MKALFVLPFSGWSQAAGKVPIFRSRSSRRSDGLVSCNFQPDGCAVMNGQRKIRLLLADVDGTLVTQDKVLTEQAVAAAQELRSAGITLASTRGRAPRGMSMLIAPLKLEGAIAGFNGGVFVRPDLSVIESRLLDKDVAKQTVQLFLDQGLDAWVYTEKDWLIRDPKAPHVAREAWTVKFDAKVVDEFTEAHFADAVKIVGVSDDLDRVAACEKMAQEKLGQRASAGPIFPAPSF